MFDEGTGYLRPEIKVELVAKADPWPSRPMPISTYVHQQFPDAIGDGRFQVNTMQAERTMLEKALLLHEVLIQRPEGPKPRLARHYYDLFKLYKAGFGERATHDHSLYTAIIEHRRTFYRYGSVDYDALITEGFSIIPKVTRVKSGRRITPTCNATCSMETCLHSIRSWNNSRNSKATSVSTSSFKIRTMGNTAFRVSDRSGTPQAGNPAEEYSGERDPRRIWPRGTPTNNKQQSVRHRT
ncbi:MAG: nucleotidyl transferase AbiEii/AbiGii toxin family protein [Flavobacteriales bacterium]|nr:nucleotidyl transferase AbiEii/AbiGii toxin family protein [Flavobacteriales bacterium]